MIPEDEVKIKKTWPRGCDLCLMYFDENAIPHHEKECPTQRPSNEVIDWFSRGLKESSFWIDGNICYVNRASFMRYLIDNWKEIGGA